MGGIATLFFGFLNSALPGLFGKWLDFRASGDARSLEGFKTAAGFDAVTYQAWLGAQVELARMKVAANGWWGARAIILICGGSASLHFASIMLDTVPFWTPYGAHVVGAWGVPKLPPPYDGYEWTIIQSFFLVAPAMPLFTAASMWLARKK